MRKTLLVVIPAMVLTLMFLSVSMITQLSQQSATITAYAAAACPDPGQCTCNPSSGVMTDHAMSPPFNRMNNGCTSADAPSELPSNDGGSSSNDGGSSSNDRGSS